MLPDGRKMLDEKENDNNVLREPMNNYTQKKFCILTTEIYIVEAYVINLSRQ